MEDSLVQPISLRRRLLERLHESHMGIVKTKSLARNYLWWPGMDSDIENVISGCQQCQYEKRKSAVKSEIISWITTTFPMERSYVLVDDFSKWPEAIIKNDTSAETNVKLRHEIISRVGMPGQLVSDNGPQFISEKLREFLYLNDQLLPSKVQISVSHAPQATQWTMMDGGNAVNQVQRTKVPVQSKGNSFLRNEPH
ncbi:hypothetical protein RF11_14079 [Thelohanellus kitauei]|uniref:Integrase catalytic domain-containing protein n=1 Tax=Thelohanellus kitauei TaxID=669202 RepID=A0A0C2MTX7_THEKT|nr:hypothetical protein RF11_14079 [Thelohanellus kitauei]